MRRLKALASILLSCASTSGLAPGLAQGASSPWAGEWGSFSQRPAPLLREFAGHGLSISDCTQQHCTFSLLSEDKAGDGNAKGLLQLQSSTEAVAHLLSDEKEYCSLHVTLDPKQPSIKLQPRAGNCSYFATPGATFLGSYPLHTRRKYVFWDTDACFAATDPAMQSLCTSQQLSALQSKWQTLFYQVADLGIQPNGLNEGMQEQSAQDALIKNCDSAAQVAACLTAGFQRSSKELESRQADWLASVTDPGEPGKAALAAAAIAGNYRHSFPNSDVQGEHFTSTDTLKIARQTNDAIDYSLHLNFYNGHECSLKGRATYRRAGFFVDQQQPDEPGLRLCIFEIHPGEKGVTLSDPTGACKMMSCGERGGYNGAGFSFNDRHPLQRSRGR